MRILHVINRYWPAPGGAERHLQEYAERQAADGHDVTVLTTNAFDLAYFWDGRKQAIARASERHNGVRIERFPIIHLPPNGLGFRIARRLLGELDRYGAPTGVLRRISRFAPFVPGITSALKESAGRWDAVHGMNIAIESILWPALAHARAAGVQFLLTPLLHLGESPKSPVRRYYTMRHQTALARRADVVLTQTPTEASYYASRGVRAQNMIQAGAGVNPPDAIGGDAEQFRREHSINGPIVFSLGAMAFDKGTAHLVQAMEILWRAGENATLVLAGPQMDEFQSFMAAQSSIVRARTQVLGYIDDQTKRDLLAAGDVFVLASRTDSFGIVFLEAWLNGCPVIGADAGGIPDIVQNGDGGIIVPFADPPALARAVDVLLRDRALAARMAENGARRTQERYTWSSVYQRVEAAFQRGPRRE